MDPNECLKRIHEFLDALKSGDCVDQWCADLQTWLDKGGFEPEWHEYELGSAYFRCWKVQELR